MPSTYYDVSQNKRKNGRSSVAAAAYRSGEAIKDERQNLTFDYTNKQNIAHTEIIAPDNAPEWTQDRAKLWNMVEVSEKRKDAQTARELTISLHEELTLEENKKLIQKHIKENFVSMGMIADLAIHDEKAIDGSKNIHAHVMLTMRELDGNEFSAKKNRDWNKKNLVTDWRKSWETMSNEALAESGIDETIAMLRDSEIENPYPVKNLSLQAYQMEKKGLQTYEGEIYKNEVMQFEKQIAHNDNAVIADLRASAVGGSTIHKNLYSQALQDLKYEQALEKQQEERNRKNDDNVKGKKPFTIIENDTNNKNYVSRPEISWYIKNNSTIKNPDTEPKHIGHFEHKKLIISEPVNTDADADAESGNSSNARDSIFNQAKYLFEKSQKYFNSELGKIIEMGIALQIKYYQHLQEEQNKKDEENILASVGRGAIGEDNLHHQKEDKESLRILEDKENINNNNLIKKQEEKSSFTDRIKSKANYLFSSWTDKVTAQETETSEDIQNHDIHTQQNVAEKIITNKEENIKASKNSQSGTTQKEYVNNLLKNNESTLQEEDKTIKPPENKPDRGR